MTAIDLLRQNLINLQKEQDRLITIKEFAEYLEENESSLNLMMNGKRPVSNNKLVKFGMKTKDARFYELAGKEPPDPDFEYFQENWKDFDPKLRKQLRQDAENYAADNKKKKK